MSDEQQPLKGEPKRLSVAILGCGKLGTSMLQGFLSHKQAASAGPKSPSLSLSALEISHICVTVRCAASRDRIQRTVQLIQSTTPETRPNVPNVSIRLQDHNGRAAAEADIIILGCKPYDFKDILGEKEVRRGLLDGEKRKALVSTLGGVTIAQLESCLYESESHGFGNAKDLPDDDVLTRRCTVIRAVPNIASRIQESMTILSSPSPLSLRNDEKEVSQVLALLGPTKHLREAQLNHASALAASSLAFYARIIFAMADGGLGGTRGEALSLEDAMWISAQAARGTSGLLIGGEDPEAVVKEVATQGGSTMSGLKVMEESGALMSMTEAVVKCAMATLVLSQAKRQ